MSQSIDDRIAKLEAASAEKRAALEAEKERLAKVAALDEKLRLLRILRASSSPGDRARVLDQIYKVKKERDALVPHRARKVAP